MAKEQKLDSIEERLKAHARSFEGLLSLIPAKHYYEQDNSDQWRKKKQTKAEARAAKMAKLDPDNYKSAQDVLNEKQAEFRKRKRAEISDDGDPDGKGKDGMPQGDSSDRDSKRAKRVDGHTQSGKEILKHQVEDVTKKTAAEKASARADKRGKRQEEKKNQKAKKQDAAELKQDQTQQLDALEEEESAELYVGEPERLDESSLQKLENSDSSNDRLASPDSGSSPTRSLSSGFDGPLDQSGSSSITSMPPQSPEHTSTATLSRTSKETAPDRQDHDPEELKRRLQARIEGFRAARKADDPQGLPRSRQELIDSRRQKEEQRKARKKEMRRQLKEEEAQRRADTLARGSPLLSPGSPHSIRSEANNFSFGNIEFKDGQKLSADLGNLIQPRKAVKGPSDPATALLAAQKNESRLASLDRLKRDDIGEKESWLNARKRAQGERIRDDTSLLKKTLKRKQSQKKKSEKEWKERIDGVKKREEMRQKKREANLKQRRDEKGGKGGKKSKGSKARPGFEGSFRAKAPSGKNKHK